MEKALSYGTLLASLGGVHGIRGSSLKRIQEQAKADAHLEDELNRTNDPGKNLSVGSNALISTGRHAPCARFPFLHSESPETRAI